MRAIRLRLSQPRARSTAPPCGRCTRSALADRAGAYRRGGSFSSGRRLILRLLALPEGRDEPRQPFCKFIAAGQSQPTLLHVEIALDRGWTQGGFRQQPAFLRTLKALTDFFAEVLEHGAPPKNYRRERDWSLSHRRLSSGCCLADDDGSLRQLTACGYRKNRA